MIVITGVFESQNLPNGPFEKPLPTSQNDGVRRTRGGKINSLATIQ